MKIALTQRPFTIRGIEYDCLEHGWYRLLTKHDLVPIPNVATFYPPGIDFLILTGGNSSPARDQVERSLTSWAMAHEIPIIGVCHGAFFLNEYFGGSNGTIDGHKNTVHLIEMHGQEYEVNSFHGLSISNLAKNLNVLATCVDDIEAFKHENKQIWGIIWHPERMDVPILPQELKDILL